MSDNDRPLTDAELAALDAEITDDSEALKNAQDALNRKVLRYRTEMARRAGGSVHPFRPRPSGPDAE
jgi:hypothetical protein